MGLSEEDKNTNSKNILRNANVPEVMWGKTLPDLKKHGEDLREYITSKQSYRDSQTGRGKVFSGESSVRIILYNTFVKELALTGDSTYHISLHKLVMAHEYGEQDALLRLARIRTLAISYFYDSGLPECPYHPGQRAKVEDFLRDKMHKKDRLIISSTSPIKDMLWWSSDFRYELNNVCEELRFGKNNRD